MSNLTFTKKLSSTQPRLKVYSYPLRKLTGLLFFLIACKSALSGELKNSAFKWVQQKYPQCSTQFSNKEILPEHKKLILKKVGQEFYTSALYQWKLNCPEGAYTAWVDNVMGRDLPITFAVIFDSLGRITQTTVLKYREDYGGEVQSTRWLKQFIGKKESDGWVAGKDVEGISGATISVHSLIKGHKKLAHLFALIHSTPGTK